MARLTTPIRSILALAAFAAVTAGVAVAFGGGSGFEITETVVNTGGGTSASVGFELTGTLGQSVASTQLTSASFELSGGFWTDTNPAPTPCPGNTNGDQIVNVDDLNNVILDWGTDGTANGGDIAGPTPGSPPDGIVNVNDLNAVIVGWGMCP